MKPSPLAVTLPRITSESFWSSEEDQPERLERTEPTSIGRVDGTESGFETATRDQGPETSVGVDVVEAVRDLRVPTVLPRIAAVPSQKFKVLRKWEGRVMSVNCDSFTAALVDLAGAEPREEAEFALEEISEEDLKLVRAGAVFYWSIGTRVTRAGQRLNESVIRFRRLPAWSALELTIAKQEARGLMDTIGWQG